VALSRTRRQLQSPQHEVDIATGADHANSIQTSRSLREANMATMTTNNAPALNANEL
jgi:hypothetical protein